MGSIVPVPTAKARTTPHFPKTQGTEWASIASAKASLRVRGFSVLRSLRKLTYLVVVGGVARRTFGSTTMGRLVPVTWR